MAPNAPQRPHYSASIRPRPRRDGTIAYDVRYRLDGSSRTLSFGTQKAAERWAGIVRTIGPAEALKFVELNSKPGTPTIDEYVDTYLATKSGVEPKTIDHYRMFMRRHISPVMGHMPLDAVSKETIAAWVNGMRDSGAAAKSIANRHGFLSAMFQNAVDDGVVPSNPCAKTKLPETERREMVFLSPDEFTVLLSYIPERYQPLVLLLAVTGMRWGEATALRPGDFDLAARRVRVSRAWKSSKGRGWYIGPPKTSRSKRVITLPEDVIPIVAPLLTAGTEYVFTNRRGHAVRQQNFFEAAWSPARRLANGLPPFDTAKADKGREWTAKVRGVWDGRKPADEPIGKWPRVHDLRHSHVGWLLSQGIGIDVISRRLGHESIQTTIDIYGHIAQERMEAAGAAAGLALAGAMPQILP